MSKDIERLPRPDIGYGFYYVEIILLIVAALVPMVFWLAADDSALIGNSGSIVVFLCVVVEFMLLRKADVKHLRNTLRVLAGESPKNFSTESQHITIAALVIASLGTLLWGFGSEWFGAV